MDYTVSKYSLGVGGEVVTYCRGGVRKYIFYF